LQVQEHEEIIVLHPVLKRGYRVCIRGIGRNFELHTLLFRTDMRSGQDRDLIALRPGEGRRFTPSVLTELKRFPAPRLCERTQFCAPEAR
jgi:hypothetical protein